MLRSYTAGLVSNTLTAAALTVAVAAAGGCLNDKEVAVGAEGGGLSLDNCVGESTDCSSDVKTKTVALPKAKSCNKPTKGALELDFKVDIVKDICPDDPTCSFQVKSVALAPDNSSWLVGLAGFGGLEVHGQTLWLAHYSATGENVSVTEIGSGVPLIDGGSIQYETDVVADARGHAYVAVYEVDGGPNADYELEERMWVQEYKPTGRAANAAIALSGIGVPRLSLDSEGRVIIAADALNNAKHGVLAQLSADGRLLWSQTDVRTYGRGQGVGIAGVSVDRTNAITVLAQRDWKVSTPSRFGISRFDDEGNLLWDRVLDGEFGDGWPSASAGDADGNVTMCGIGYGKSENTITLNHLDANGEPRWSYAFEEENGFGVTTEASTGRVYFTSVTFTDTGSKGELVEISEDGQECERYAIPADTGGADVIAATGEIYFFGPSLGRFKPIVRE